MLRPFFKCFPHFAIGLALVNFSFKNGGEFYPDEIGLNRLRTKPISADGFVEYRDYLGYCAQSVAGKWKNAQCDTDKLNFMCKQKIGTGTALKSLSRILL